MKQFIKTSLVESFNNLDYNEIINDKFINNEIEATIDRGYPNSDDDEIYNFVVANIDSNYENAYFNIQKVIKGNKIIIYRALLLGDDWMQSILEHKDSMGIFWAYDYKAAIPHWGYNDKSKPKLIVIEAETDETNVDWVETMRLNSSLDYYEEKEIRLKKGSPIKLVSINTKKINDPKLLNIKFKA